MLTNDERRGFKRLETETDVTITRLTTGESLIASLVNLSATGCAFRSDQPIASGEALEILVSSPSKRIEPLHRSARVTRVCREEDDWMVAVEFLLDQA